MYKIIDNQNGQGFDWEDSIEDPYEQADALNEPKICEEYESGKPADTQSVKRKVQNPKYFCSKCGRSTLESHDLCSPEVL